MGALILVHIKVYPQVYPILREVSGSRNNMCICRYNTWCLLVSAVVDQFTLLPVGLFLQLHILTNTWNAHTWQFLPIWQVCVDIPLGFWFAFPYHQLDTECLIKCWLTIRCPFCKRQSKSMAIFLLSCLCFFYWFTYLFYIFRTRAFCWLYVLEISYEACLFATLIISFSPIFHVTFYFLWTCFTNSLLTEIFHLENKIVTLPHFSNIHFVLSHVFFIIELPILLTNF